MMAGYVVVSRHQSNPGGSMSFSLGPKSLAELRGVHPRLVECVHLAIDRSVVDFGVHDGLRTAQEQREYVRVGTSTTMNSKHLTQVDGFGHAVDLVPYINGKLRWEWEPIYRIAAAMCSAARELNVSLRWGGVWDRRFPQDFKGSVGDMRFQVEGYVARRRKENKRAFIDGPHFELS